LIFGKPRKLLELSTGKLAEGLVESCVDPCKVHAEVPQERVPKRGKTGQSDTSERSWEPGMRGTEGLASAWRLHPHGMPMPYVFRMDKAGLRPSRGTRETGLKEKRDGDKIT